MEYVVDHIGVYFHARVVDSAVRCSPQVADSCRRRPNQNDFSVERSRWELSCHNVGYRKIRITSPWAPVIDLHLAQVIRFDLQLVAKVEANNSDLVEGH